MADAPDPDFPDDPARAAVLAAQLNRLAARLSATFWDTLRPLRTIAKVLHQQFWLQPVASPLPAAITQLTGLDETAATRLFHLPDVQAYLRELVLRAPQLYAFVAIARHLLDSPLGTTTLRLALADDHEPAPTAVQVQELHAYYVARLDGWQDTLAEWLTQLDPDQDLTLLNLQLASILSPAGPSQLVPLLAAQLSA